MCALFNLLIKSNEGGSLHYCGPLAGLRASSALTLVLYVDLFHD